MKHWQTLVELGGDYRYAPTIADKMVALYGIRNLLNEVDPLELFVSIDTALLQFEALLTEDGKEELRAINYQFSDELDNVPEMLCDNE